MLKYVLFDLDGTLSDTSEGILNGFMYTLQRLGFTPPAYKNDLRPMIGPPLTRSLQEIYGLSEERVREGWQYYRDYYGSIGAKECTVYPGIPELLQALRAKGTHIMTATSKVEPFTRTALQHLGLIDAFDFFGCADMEGKRREKEDVIAHVKANIPDIDATNTIMVGDRIYDIVGAHLNGLPVISCTYGFATPGELEAESADYTVNTVAELHKLLLSF